MGSVCPSVHDGAKDANPICKQNTQSAGPRFVHLDWAKLGSPVNSSTKIDFLKHLYLRNR